MGIPATIKASLEMEYDVDLRVPTSETGCAVSNSSRVSFSVPASRAAAPAIKRSGYLVTLGHLIAPYIREDKSPGEPTLDNPYDVYTSTLTAHLELERLAVVDGTGAEVWSCTPGDLLPSSKAAPRTDPTNWLGIIDYPNGAIAARLSGVATVDLKIASDGSVTGCTLVGSTGSALLDAATCPAVQKKARFTPAADAMGKAIPGEYTAKVPWKWPY